MKVNIIFRFFVILMLLFSVYSGNSDAYDKPEDGLLAERVNENETLPATI